MKVNITNLYGFSPRSVALMAQNMVASIARDLGYHELAIYAYPVESDTPSELNSRLDGIIARMGWHDIVIFQYPTWNNMEFDELLFRKLKSYPHSKVIFFVHDIQAMMFPSNFYLIDRTINLFNQADALILPSQEMLDQLRTYGLTVEKIIIQKMWDHPTNVELEEAAFKRVIQFPGRPDRFEFAKNWQYDIPMNLYAELDIEASGNIVRKGWLSDEALISELSRGGFGIIWYNEDIGGLPVKYHEFYCPYKLGLFVAAGIPVIVKKGIANQEFLVKNGLVIPVDSIDEAVRVVEEMTEEEYYQRIKKIRSFNYLVREGYFTKKLLTDAVYQVLTD